MNEESRKTFVFYKSFYEAIRELRAEERLAVFEAIMEYEYEQKEPNLTGTAKAIFVLIKPQLDASNTRYEASVENGRKGGRPKKENLEKPSNNLDETQQKPRQNLGKTQRKPSQNLNDNDNDNDNENDNEKQNDNTSISNSKNIFKFYTNNINQMPTPREIELLESYEADTPHDLIIYAMEKAVENKARSMRIRKSDPKQLESKRHNNNSRSQRGNKRQERKIDDRSVVKFHEESRGGKPKWNKVNSYYKHKDFATFMERT